METQRNNVRVIDPVPVGRGPFRWWIVVGFLTAWAVLVVAAVWIKLSLVRVLLPGILVILLIYLLICTLYLLRNRKQ